MTPGLAAADASAVARPRRRVRLIGIGPGGPEDLTVAAATALGELDLVLVADKDRGVEDLAALRTELCRRYGRPGLRVIEVPDPPRDRDPATDAAYDTAVADWHAARAERYAAVLVEELAAEQTAGFLVWGDPALYDSTIRIVERITDGGLLEIDYDVLPGVSAVSMLAARHRLVLNRIGRAVTITTGRRLAAHIADGHDDLVVMLDGHLACAELTGDWDIWWGANLGTGDEELVAGALATALPQIRAARARAKAARGWVMDTYLLRRR